MTMPMSVKNNIGLGGKQFSESSSITGDGAIVHDVSVGSAEAGSLTTRTDADTGVVTDDDSSHSITDADLVDLYWDGGSRRGMTVTIVSGADISIDGGLGDDLPVQDTAVAIVIPTELDLAVLGTNVVGIALYTESRGQFVFHDVGGEELFKRLGDGVVWSWHENNGEVNPITGDTIIKALVSHDDVLAAKNMKVGVVYDND